MESQQLNDLLRIPFCNICMALVDSFVEENVKLRNKMGVHSVIIRQVLGNCCDWCQNLAGTYDADDVPADIYRRHDNCRCMVIFKSDKKKYTNVHTKNEFSKYRDARIDAQNLANVPMDAKMKKRRKREDSEAGERLALRKLRIACDEGQASAVNTIIAEKILNGKFSLKQRHQKYLQHKKGTTQYDNATKGRAKKQSYFTISEEEAQNLIYQHAGFGEPHNVEAKKDHEEFITTDRIVGKYFENSQWHTTNRIQIVYSNKGTHIIPVKTK